MVFQTPPTPSPEADIRSALGIATFALGVAYLATSYMPISQNQFLHASAPVRMLIGALCGLKLLIGRNKLTKNGRQTLLMLGLYDGIGGFLVGYWLGRWDGLAHAGS
jgi:hypothetical protein